METSTWTFEELQFEFLVSHERTREEWNAYSAKSELLNDMLMELYSKKDFESETVKFIDHKRDIVREKRDKFYDIQKYLGNLKDGYPFNVNRLVGRYMTKFGLTAEQSEMFLNIHKNHMAAMGTENQKKYARTKVKNVVWDYKDDCLKVYYEDIWWHYTKKGEWY